MECARLLPLMCYLSSIIITLAACLLVTIEYNRASVAPAPSSTCALAAATARRQALLADLALPLPLSPAARPPPSPQRAWLP